MNTITLIGTEAVASASQRIREAAAEMSQVASRIETAFILRRQWEEEYLSRIEAIVREELDTYKLNRETP